MKTFWTLLLALCFVTINMYGQLRLNVQGDASIAGNLTLGNPESNISGLDQLLGFNDLRFATGDPNKDDMVLTEDGRLGLGTSNPSFALHILGETGSTNIGISNTSTGGKTYGLYSTGAANGEGAGAFMIRDETAGVNRFFLNPSGLLGIGTITPSSRLHVENTEGTVTSISGRSAFAADFTRGIYGLSELGTVRGIGVEGAATGLTGQQAGLEATSTGGGTAVRIGAIGRVSGAGSSGTQYGAFGWILSTESTGPRYAVYGLITGDGTGAAYSGYFPGDVTVTGTFDNPSDEKLKKDIKSLDKTIDRIMTLNPVRYQFRNQDYPQMNLAKGTQMGFIAQEVERVFPELIKENFHPEVPRGVNEIGAMTDFYPAVTYKGINYLGLIPVLTRATQEQQEEILDLRAENTAKDRRIAELEDRLARLERMVEQIASSGSSAQTVPITDASLLQNQPNPFTRETLINYAIPNTVNRAELRITDVNGRLLKTIIIDQRGEGQTRLQAQSLSTGTYFYSLVLDGEVLETRKMVLTR